MKNLAQGAVEQRIGHRLRSPQTIRARPRANLPGRGASGWLAAPGIPNVPLGAPTMPQDGITILPIRELSSCEIYTIGSCQVMKRKRRGLEVRAGKKS